MLRKIIHIDEARCNGCGACARACHEGAIEMIGGKAVLTREDYCDGLGDCLPACPTGAIRFEVREAPAYDEQAVLAAGRNGAASCACPGDRVGALAGGEARASGPAHSRLMQWPVQIKLVPVHAPYFERAKLLIAADCTAFAYGNFHEAFIRDHITLIGCPKLDAADYAVKLTEILSSHEIERITVVRMEVPCCGGLEHAVTRAIAGSGKRLPLQVVTVSTDGKILN